jgi:AraC-like DNA-binding protein
MDPLSEVLLSVRLTGGVFLAWDFSAPWCVSVAIAPDDCMPFIQKPMQMLAYHVVLDGELVVAVDGEPTVKVGAGEIVMFPHNDAHTLGSAPGLKPISAGELLRSAPGGQPFRMSHGGGGAVTRIVCGFLASEEPFNPLISTLPKVLKVDVRRSASREWIETSVRFAAGELAEGRLASSGVMTRLSETLLTEAVQQFSATRPDDDLGWLRGLKDPYIGRALVLIHRRMGEPWSADLLASEVALSRSAFVERFTSLVGMPPIRYLTVVRLQAAKNKLRETGKSIAELAYSFGYDSGEGFSRAFKREYGVSPAQWREQNSTEN